MNLNNIYSDFSDDIRDYMLAHGGNPSSLMRVLQRLQIKLPSSPTAAHDLVVHYLRSNGEEDFREKMGLLRTTTPDPIPAAEPDRPVSLSWKNRAAKDSLNMPPKPRMPSDPWAATERVQARESTRGDLQAPPMPAAPPPGFAPGGVASATSDLPSVLRGIPRGAITPEALAAAKAGRSPFGPSPLIDRRSGLDRRCGEERRQEVELVFRNSRYGRDRREAPDRRRNPAPARDPSRPAGEAVGNPTLVRLGWKPGDTQNRAKNGGGAKQ